MNGRAIRAGAAFIELYLDSKKLEQGLAKARAKLQAFGQAAGAIGRSMVGFSAAALAPIAFSLATFASFSAQMSAVKAITGSTQAQFERLEATARALGASTSFSASEVAAGMKYLGMAGYNTEQIIAGIPGVLNLARAGAIELGMAADIASDVGSAFGLAADDITRIADVMAVTASSANTSIEMMGETLKYAAPLAKAAGQSLEDTATAIGIMGNSGIKASMAGTDLALIFKLIGDKARGALKGVGVETVDAAGNIRSVVDVMHELGDATRNMTEADRLAFFAQNFDRAAKSAIILADAGAPMDALRDKINNADGAAAEMAATMGDNLMGAVARLMSALEAIQISIGKALQGPIRAAIEIIAKVEQVVSNWIERNHGLVAVLAVVAAAVGTVGVGLMGFGLAAMLLSGIIGGLTTLFGMAASAIAFLATPLGLGIIAIAGLTTALVALAAGLLYVSGVFGWLATQINNLWGLFNSVFVPFLSALANSLLDGNFERAAKIMWLSVEAVFQKAMADILRLMTGWTGAIGSMLMSVASGMESLAGKNLFTRSLKEIAVLAKYSDQLADVMDRKATRKLRELQGLIDEANNPKVPEPEKTDKPPEAETAPVIPDLAGIGRQVAEAVRFSVGTFSDVGAMAIRSQARPMEKVEKLLEDQGEDIAAIRRAAEDGDGVVFA